MGYSKVTEPGYVGQLTAYGTLAADTPSYLCSFKGGMEDPIANQQMLQKALAIKEKQFGEHHWRVAPTLNDLATTYSKLGDHRTQKELVERALKITETHFGEDHCGVAITLRNLGVAYTELREYEKAKELCGRALKIQEQHYDQDHLEAAKT